jgi:hypothetical protein
VSRIGGVGKLYILLVHFMDMFLVNYVAICYILWLCGISFPRFGMLYHKKSGNPDSLEFTFCPVCEIRYSADRILPFDTVGELSLGRNNNLAFQKK